MLRRELPHLVRIAAKKRQNDRFGSRAKRIRWGRDRAYPQYSRVTAVYHVDIAEGARP